MLKSCPVCCTADFKICPLILPKWKPIVKLSSHPPFPEAAPFAWGILCHCLFDTWFWSLSQMADVTSNSITRACQQLLTFKGGEKGGALLQGDLVPLRGYLTWDHPAVWELEPRTIWVSGNYYFHASPITVDPGWFLRRFPSRNGTSTCCLYLGSETSVY